MKALQNGKDFLIMDALDKDIRESKYNNNERLFQLDGIGYWDLTTPLYSIKNQIFEKAI